MSIGYASINSIIIGFEGEVITKEVDGIYITEVNYVSDVDADLDNSKILSAYQTNLNSSITLSDSNKDSSITYEITIKNTFDYDYIFNSVEYLEDDYSNTDISYTLFGMSIGDDLIAGDSVTFTITFHYKDNVLSSNNTLKSLINFDFIIKPYIVAEYDYTGDYETFVVPHDGIYKIELWGASGGDDKTYIFNAQSVDFSFSERTAKFIGGYGSYTSGEITLKKGTELFIYVGEQGKRNILPTFNGGGAGAIGGTGYNGQIPDGSHDANGFSGGGATDIRLKSGVWSDFDSLKSRIMVAGGGGGTTVEYYNTAGQFSHAGGLTGFSGGYYSGHPYLNQNGKGGSQTSGGVAASIHFNSSGTITDGKFGIGGYTTSISSQTGAGGGGGGYYGGSGASGTLAGGSGQGGGGGSSFISGHNGCDAILESSTESNIMHSGQSIHYSNYVFTNTLMIDGFGYSWTNIQNKLYTMPSYNEEPFTTTGNIGNGYAKITYLREK